MRHITQLGLAAATAMAFPLAAQAADIPAPVVKAPPPVVLVSSWTGFYFGAHAGGAWGSHTYSGGPAGDWVAFGPPLVPFLAANETPKLKSSGFVGGGQLGYNYQTGSIVWGFEADGSGLGLKKSRNTGVISDPFGTPSVFTENAKVSWLATARPRLGLATNNALFFVTGGLAVGEVSSTSGLFRPLSGYNSFGSTSKTKAGWTAGGGVEYMFASNWSVAVQYLYVDLGKVSYRTTDRSLGFPTFFENLTTKTQVNLATVSVNYKFGAPSVVARY